MRLSQSVWSLHLLASIHARQTPSRILGQGIEAWNRWRAEAPEVRPCLNGADLRGIDFGIPILHLATILDGQVPPQHVPAEELHAGQLRGG